jgi:isoprenylcysteine carboxyl methyltransferase (ICMT) family protein YpbQ
MNTSQNCYILSQCAQIHTQNHGGPLDLYLCPLGTHVTHLQSKWSQICGHNTIMSLTYHYKKGIRSLRGTWTTDILPTPNKLLLEHYLSSFSANPLYSERVLSTVAASSITHQGVIQSRLFPHLQLLLYYLLQKHFTKVYWKDKNFRKQIKHSEQQLLH